MPAALLVSVLPFPFHLPEDSLSRPPTATPAAQLQAFDNSVVAGERDFAAAEHYPLPYSDREDDAYAAAYSLGSIRELFLLSVYAWGFPGDRLTTKRTRRADAITKAYRDLARDRALVLPSFMMEPMYFRLPNPFVEQRH